MKPGLSQYFFGVQRLLPEAITASSHVLCEFRMTHNSLLDRKAQKQSAMTKLFEHLKQLCPLGNELQSKLKAHTFYLTKPKDSYLLTEGEVCRHIWYLEHGLIRCYYSRNHQEVTTWFLSEDNFITLFESLLRQKQSLYSIELLEPSAFYGIRYDALREILKEHPELMQAGHALKRIYSLMDTRKIRATSQLIPPERYAYFQKHHGHLLSRLKLAHIASYLDMNIRTLTRVRKNP